MLRNNYINVISPFKLKFAKTEHGKAIKINQKHVYETQTDFSRYKELYEKERNTYKNIYDNISKFESTFNAIVSHKCIMHYDICDSKKFEDFIVRLKGNVQTINENVETKNHMIQELDGFQIKMNKYDDIYIFFDRLTLNSIITVYKLCDKSLKDKIYQTLKDNNCVLDYTRQSLFDEMLVRLVLVRNCVYHNNSINILKRYYRIKTRTPRSSSDRHKFETLIEKLSK